MCMLIFNSYCHNELHNNNSQNFADALWKTVKLSFRILMKKKTTTKNPLISWCSMTFCILLLDPSSLPLALHYTSTMPEWQDKIMYLCMRKWKYIFMSSDTTQSHASKRGLFTHTHTHWYAQTKDRKRRGRRGRVARYAKTLCMKGSQGRQAA